MGADSTRIEDGDKGEIFPHTKLNRGDFTDKGGLKGLMRRGSAWFQQITYWNILEETGIKSVGVAITGTIIMAETGPDKQRMPQIDMGSVIAPNVTGVTY